MGLQLATAGEAPETVQVRALQESRQDHTGAASSVAYAETRGAANLLNWTEAGPKVVLMSVEKYRGRQPLMDATGFSYAGWY